MHLSYLANPNAVTQPNTIPNQLIAQQVTHPIFSAFFVLVMNLVIPQTAVGLLQGVIERLDNLNCTTRGKPLTKLAHGLISGTTMLACLILSNLGISTILAWMYGVTFCLFLFVFAIPFLTVAVYKIFFVSAQHQ
jgi:uncharacterized membrane protein YkvI